MLNYNNYSLYFSTWVYLEYKYKNYGMDIFKFHHEGMRCIRFVVLETSKTIKGIE